MLFYFGVFLISFGALALEIVQTRILSVVVWYHLAFFCDQPGYIANAVFSASHPDVRLNYRRAAHAEVGMEKFPGWRVGLG
jgi:hypothetical protein